MSVQLTGSVGYRGRNREADVVAVQAALKAATQLTLDPALDPGPVDGDSGVGTEGAIVRFQRRIGNSRPDGRIDPGGNTLLRLNALLGIGSILITYPFDRPTTTPFFGVNAGMRAFGSRRSGGSRAHAGVDFYFPDFTPVLSVADGTVVRGPYPFYLKTFAVEVDHGAFVARYGELAPEDTPFVREGERVERGQQVGRVGILLEGRKRLNVPSMMLHFEMYDKTERGDLTRASGTSGRHTNGVPFLRRRDLVDPSGFMMRAPLP